MSPANKTVKGSKKSSVGKRTTSRGDVDISGKGKVKGRAISNTGKALKIGIKKDAGIGNSDGAEEAEVVEESGVPVFSSIPDGVDFVNDIGDGDDEAIADGDDGNEDRMPSRVYDGDGRND